MDTFDSKILDLIQRNNRISTEKIAEKVGLSPSAVQRRIRQMRKDGVIHAEVAVVKPEAAGRMILSIVGVIIDNERPLAKALKEFRDLMLASPEVMQVYDVTGEADFIVIVSAKDMTDYEEISRRLFMDNPNVRRYKSSLVIRRIKYGMTIPIATT
ncbi:MAG: Lrp/AsnC family transcriptional regulator [Blastocatellia bacterium]|nr:Lrp/AsnC family transcriptional regulator [Blastocatellia bacterium]